MDVSHYAAGPEAYDTLSAYQITNFFNKNGLTKSEVNQFATNLIGSSVSATPVQGGSSYTVFSDKSNQVVQFRVTQLPECLIDLARRLYGDFVPACKAEGMFGPVYVYVASLVPGAAFCRVRKQFFSADPAMERRLQQTVQDLARFLASAWINKSTHTSRPPPGLLGEYFKVLDDISPDLPLQLQEKLGEVRRGLPRLFKGGYPITLQHDDLLENNFHVDEATGRITGIVDWADAKIAPFGVSLASMEIVLGIQTRTDWHFHHNHQALRKLFWNSFYEITGYISDDDRYSLCIARLFGLFRNHGYEEKEYAISYLSALCFVDTGF